MRENVFATYNEVIAFLYDQLPMFQRSGGSAFKKDLKNTFALCNALDNPQHKFRSIHIGGTNGKGSCSHYLASILQEAGYKTGLYTSPHLKSFTERIKINGKQADERFIIDFINRIYTKIEEIKPSFFELTVAMAFEYFAQGKVDMAVIEVGMGGRLDSTNVIKPEVALITNISYDHAQWLGETLPEIAVEKAGIIKPGVPVVIGELQPEVKEVFDKSAERAGSKIIYAEETVALQITDHGLSLNFSVARNTSVQLAGNFPAYQHKNLASVCAVVEVLMLQGYNITSGNICDGILNIKTNTQLKGRWQVLSQMPLTICDVGHNEAGVKYVVEELGKLDYQQLHMVIGMVGDKDVEAILKLLPHKALYYFCALQIPRSMEVDKLFLAAENIGLKGGKFATVESAIKKARERAKSGDVIFIGGSNFTVAEIPEL